MSPHVTIYDFPAAALSSIANRVSGVALVGGKRCVACFIVKCFVLAASPQLRTPNVFHVDLGAVSLSSWARTVVQYKTTVEHRYSAVSANEKYCTTGTCQYSARTSISVDSVVFFIQRRGLAGRKNGAVVV